MFSRAGRLVFLETLVFLEEIVFLWCLESPLQVFTCAGVFRQSLQPVVFYGGHFGACF